MNYYYKTAPEQQKGRGLVQYQLAEAYSSKGAAYYKPGQYHRAKDSYSKAIDINSLDAAAYRGRGDVYNSLVEGCEQAKADYANAAILEQ